MDRHRANNGQPRLGPLRGWSVIVAAISWCAKSSTGPPASTIATHAPACELGSGMLEAISWAGFSSIRDGPPPPERLPATLHVAPRVR